MTIEEFKEIALSFPQTIANPHFDRTAFKVEKKRIFATLHEPSNSANIKFNAIDQSVFSTINKAFVYPISNEWGLQGWTTFELSELPKKLVQDALNTAYLNVLKPK